MKRVAASVVLRSLLDTYPYTARLKAERPSDRIHFSFDEVRPIYDGFPRVVRTSEFDLAELATVTLLQAYAAGRRFILLPIGLLSRFHHRSTIVRTDRGIQKPADLAGRRIGVRSYTQTTVVWARGILEAEYGLDSSGITWVSLEGPHVPEFQEPASVIRASAGATLETLILDGDVDAAIVGRDRPEHPSIRTLIEDPDEELRWFARGGILPINHLLVLSPELADSHPWLIAELGRLFASCRSDYLRNLARDPRCDPVAASLVAHGVDPLPFGYDAIRPALEAAIAYSHAQGLLPKGVAAEQLFDDRVAW